MSLVFEEEYAVEWCADPSGDDWYTDEANLNLTEAKELLEFKREHIPGTKWRIAVRYVSEWKPVEGEA